MITEMKEEIQDKLAELIAAPVRESSQLP